MPTTRLHGNDVTIDIDDARETVPVADTMDVVPVVFIVETVAVYYIFDKISIDSSTETVLVSS